MQCVPDIADVLVYHFLTHVDTFNYPDWCIRIKDELALTVD